MSVCAFNSSPYRENSTLLIVAAFSGKISLHVKTSYLPTFYKNKAELLAVCLSKSY